MVNPNRRPLPSSEESVSERVLCALQSVSAHGWSDELWAGTGLRVTGMLAELRSRRSQQVGQ